jgi:hypothetical protein
MGSCVSGGHVQLPGTARLQGERPGCAGLKQRLLDEKPTKLPELKSQTKVPILLPSHFPALAAETVYAHAKADGYTIRLESDPDCDGANACFLGILRAKAGRKMLVPAGGETERDDNRALRADDLWWILLRTSDRVFYFIQSAMTEFTASAFLSRNRVSLKEALEGLELCERKLSCTVLRGLDGSNPVRLLGLLIAPRTDPHERSLAHAALIADE